MMGPAQGIGERLLALELAVASLQEEVRTLAGAVSPAPASAATELELLAQRLGNARLAAVLVRAGYTSVEAIASAPDAALLAVDGVGERALGAIRARLG